MHTDMRRDFAPDGLGGDLARGVMRLFGDMGQACVVEFNLGNGRRVDVMAVDRKGFLTVVEIKSSAADYRSDRKWQDYLPWCNAFYFAVPETFDRGMLPDGVGVMVADAYGAAVVAPSPEFMLAPARRKALTLRLAMTAGRRLMQLGDTDFV